MRTFACDFETTVYEGQTSTEVWSSALVELNHENVYVHHSIEATFYWLNQLRDNAVLYYHNLKFDGSFWLDYLLKLPTFSQAIEWFDEEQKQGSFVRFVVETCIFFVSCGGNYEGEERLWQDIIYLPLNP